MPKELTLPGKIKVNVYELILELSTWVIIILIIFGINLFSNIKLDLSQEFALIGGILAFGLLYYSAIYKFFPKEKRLYFKTVADIVLIGALIHLLGGTGKYFFILYFLPIAAAALSLEFINALFLALIAAIFIVVEVSYGIFDINIDANPYYFGIWQLGFILLITIFCRFLALEIKQGRAEKEKLLAREEALKEETKKEREFMNLTSHQLLTPLSMIRGFISMLNDGTLGELTPQQKDAVLEVYDNTKRMIDLASELLSVSRIQSDKLKLKITETHLEDLISNCVNEFNLTYPKQNVQLIYNKPINLKPIRIDSDKIRQVLLNFTENAFKYTLEGHIKIIIEQSPAWTTVKVSDSGIGIQPEDFEKLFQPFFRGRNILELDNQGTGLGLYIARLIIERHNGKIWAENNPDRGATFAFKLPMI